MKMNYDNKTKKLFVEYQLTDEHLRTLFLIKASDGYVAFENRSLTCDGDLEGNEISWQICDQLVDMGLLIEDQEAYEVAFELTKNSNIIFDKLTGHI